MMILGFHVSRGTEYNKCDCTDDGLTLSSPSAIVFDDHKNQFYHVGRTNILWYIYPLFVDPYYAYKAFKTPSEPYAVLIYKIRPYSLFSVKTIDAKAENSSPPSSTTSRFGAIKSPVGERPLTRETSGISNI